MSEMSLGLSAASYSAAKPETERHFFDVSVLKLIVMSTVTLNLYQIYWFYKNWRLAKQRGQDVNPLLRAIFAVLFAYPLFKEVREVGRAVSVNAVASASGLAFLFFALQMTWRFPDPFSLIGFTSVVPLAIVQNDIVKVHRALGVDPRVNDRFTWLNIVGIVLGGLFLLLMILVLFLVETP